jgi:hypothetical protein
MKIPEDYDGYACIRFLAPVKVIKDERFWRNTNEIENVFCLQKRFDIMYFSKSLR